MLEEAIIKIEYWSPGKEENTVGSAALLFYYILPSSVRDWHNDHIHIRKTFQFSTSYRVGGYI